ncbi:MAG: DUF1842 domain-containing protein [Gammaproteobacteria bacterium]|nr:DUF1842 domain-containing protein [Gammaproteobacteria bacterium]
MTQGTQEQIQGVFNVSYLITNHLSGGVSFRVDLHVNADRQITGVGHVFQAISPPLNVSTKLSGEWSYMCTMSSCNILVVLDGVSLYPSSDAAENTKLRMSLSEDWQSGVANFQYLQDGVWQDCDFEKVELVESSSIAKLAEITKKHAKTKQAQAKKSLA